MDLPNYKGKFLDTPWGDFFIFNFKRFKGDRSNLRLEGVRLHIIGRYGRTRTLSDIKLFKDYFYQWDNDDRFKIIKYEKTLIFFKKLLIKNIFTTLESDKFRRL
jgi:hypothetical protein